MCFYFIILFLFYYTFLDAELNLLNRILTNQKQELVVTNGRWNCICTVYVYAVAKFALQEESHGKHVLALIRVYSTVNFHACDNFAKRNVG